MKSVGVARRGAVLLALAAVVSAARADGFLAVDATSREAAADGSPAKPFATIQAAIDAAKPGDEIRVAKGTYVGGLVVQKKGLVLAGGFKGGGDFAASDPKANPTVVQGTKAASALAFRNVEDARASGFTITGGAHGVELAACKGITLSRNVVADNGEFGKDRAGGIFLSQTERVAILDNEIVNNHAGDDGGGIGIRRGRACVDLRIEGNHIAGNTIPGEHGGGVFVEGTGVVAGNLVESNAACFGGGIFLNGGSLACSSNVVRNNKGIGIFGIDYSHKGNEQHYTLDHDLVYGNSAEGIASFWASLVIRHCTVAGNAGGGFGGRDDPNMKVEIANSIFWRNGLNFKNLSCTYSLADRDLPGNGNSKGDPLFASADTNRPDFHLKSTAGRWDPAAKNGAGDWVKDDATSPAIDAGDPASDFAREPEPNGKRSDLGVYGNTPQASRSPKP